MYVTGATNVKNYGRNYVSILYKCYEKLAIIRSTYLEKIVQICTVQASQVNKLNFQKKERNNEFREITYHNTTNTHHVTTHS